LASPAAASSTSESRLPWQLVSAVCLERVPTLTPPLSSFQKKMQDYYDQLDYENSLLSDHEVRHLQDLETAAQQREEGQQLEAGVRTALDDEDAWNKEAAAFVAPTSRLSQADAADGDGDGGDVRSVERALDRPLHLIVRQEYPPNNRVTWELPQTTHRAGETMRETAERALKQCLGAELQIQFLGNAPWSFYKHYYSKPVQEKRGFTGEKVFVFKAFFQGGQLALDQCSDYKWLLREELAKSEMSRQEKKAVFKILYDEE